MEIARFHKKARRIFRRYRRLFYLLFGVAGLVILIFYFIAFFSSGMDYNSVFLRKNADASSVVYSGRDSYGDISITVTYPAEGEYGVVYRIPYQTRLKTYRLELGPEVDFWRTVRILSGEQGDVFEGKYRPGSSFLYNEEGIPVQDAQELRNGEDPYLNFTPSYRRLVGIAVGEYDRIQGTWWQLIVSVLLFLLVILDIRHPSLSEHLRILMPTEDDGDEDEDEDGEPPAPPPVQSSDTFLLVRRVLRAELLIVAVIFLFVAL